MAPLLDGYKLIVEKSTVPARTADWIDWTISRLAGREHPFDVASNPEFLREGSAVRDFLQPDRIVIGADSGRARSLLLDLYEPSFDCPIVVTSVTTAELIKQTANAFLATRISFINMISDLCEKLGVDVATVARSVGLDSRIGGHYLSAGLGFGGSCLPKDLSALIKVAEDNGVDVSMLRDVEHINTARVERLLAKVEGALWVLRHKVIGILGVAFKPDTDDIRGAPRLGPIPRLHGAGSTLRIYDPAAGRRPCALSQSGCMYERPQPILHDRVDHRSRRVPRLAPLRLFPEARLACHRDRQPADGGGHEPRPPGFRHPVPVPAARRHEAIRRRRSHRPRPAFRLSRQPPGLSAASHSHPQGRQRRHPAHARHRQGAPGAIPGRLHQRGVRRSPSPPAT